MAGSQLRDPQLDFTGLRLELAFVVPGPRIPAIRRRSYRCALQNLVRFRVAVRSASPRRSTAPRHRYAP